MGTQIKSKERVKELAEVYTNEREVNAMLNLIEDDKAGFTYDINTTFLEPSCGNGNFLIKILQRKLKTIKEKFHQPYLFKIYTLKALSTIYGIDICQENVSETRERLKKFLESEFYLHLGSYTPTKEWLLGIEYILNKNIICANALENQQNILITEFSCPKKGYFKEKIFRFSDLSSDAPIPIKITTEVHYESWGGSNQ